MAHRSSLRNGLEIATLAQLPGALAWTDRITRASIAKLGGVLAAPFSVQQLTLPAEESSSVSLILHYRLPADRPFPRGTIRVANSYAIWRGW